VDGGRIKGMRGMKMAGTLLLMVTAAGAAQQKSAETVAAPCFDVATVKPSNATDGHSHIYNDPRDGEFRAINLSLKQLMEFAYNLPQTRMVGGPAWIDSAKWDVQAKAEPEFDERVKTLSHDASTAEKRRMLQALLADRFQLTTHNESRELPVYALVVAKGGAKLGDTKENGTTISRANDHIEVQGGDSVELLAEQLALTLGRVVLNQTGMVGRYNLKVKWARDDSPDATGPSIFTALEEQLGLKLEPRKAPVDVVVVDRVAMPSEN
jgi:uncharacterized protein (TIGR03435 family)